MKLRRNIFIVLIGFTQLLLLPNYAFAEDAKKCITVGNYKASYGPSGDSQTLTNNCSRRIHVVWCHNNKDKRHKGSVCGKKGRFYQKNTVLKPGEVKRNQYTLPSNGTIYYGACFGGWYSTKTKNMKGDKYECKSKKK